MKVLRWILVIPATIVGWLLGYASKILIDGFMSGFIVGAKSFFVSKLIAAFFAGILSIMAAVWVAPNKKKLASMIGGVIMLALMVYLVIINIKLGNENMILAMVEVALTTVGVVVSVVGYCKEKDDDKKQVEMSREMYRTERKYWIGQDIIIGFGTDSVKARINSLSPEGNYIVQIDRKIEGLDKTIIDVYTEEELNEYVNMTQ
jgi:hypothetical protein